MSHDRPLIVQSDHTVLVEVASRRHEEVRGRLLRFAELVKSPEYVHTYRITPLSIWNACAAGVSVAEIEEVLDDYSRYPVPENVRREIRQTASRWGRLRLVRQDEDLVLEAEDEPLSAELAANRKLDPYFTARPSRRSFVVTPIERGRLKQSLLKLGYPTQDLAGYVTGEPLALELRSRTQTGESFALRDYQRQAAAAFHASGGPTGGSGVVVLPCGAGKTVVGMASMALLKSSTLVLVTSVTAARQWRRELLEKTTLQEDEVGEYSGHKKEIRPVTVATYQILVHRARRGDPFRHMEIFNRRNWGLIIYDEVQLLPAPIFQVTATLQARRRLGLTATLVREDRREDDVFALIGPKKVDVPWKELEAQGWVATASCCEVRVAMPADLRMGYSLANPRNKFRVAAENPAKLALVRHLLQLHRGEPTLLIGMYLDQLKALARELKLPVLTGKTPQRARDHWYGEFKSGQIDVLAVSKIANFAVDLPDAAVAIQVSGTFGSRQEEAQRLGRILRPKAGSNQARFYTLVSQDTVEQDFAHKRQRFLCEQGYEYEIVWDEEVLESGETG